MDPEEKLKEIKENYHKAWLNNDIKEMALYSVDHLCTAIEDGMDPDEAVDLIFRFSHSALDNTCHDSHEDWRQELRSFFYEHFIQSN